MTDADRIAALRPLTAGDGIEFSGVDVLRLRGPVVYLVMRGERPMYVGMSRNGLMRPFSRKHHALNGLGEDDRLQVWPVLTAEAAVSLERLLLARLKPVWNRQGRIDTQEVGGYLGVTANEVRRRWRAARLEETFPGGEEKVKAV